MEPVQLCVPGEKDKEDPTKSRTTFCTTVTFTNSINPRVDSIKMYSRLKDLHEVYSLLLFFAASSLSKFSIGNLNSSSSEVFSAVFSLFFSSTTCISPLGSGVGPLPRSNSGPLLTLSASSSSSFSPSFLFSLSSLGLTELASLFELGLGCLLFWYLFPRLFLWLFPRFL